MSDTRCPTCGKTPFSVRFVESDRDCVIGSCECAKKPEPTMAELIAEIRACRAEISAIRAEQSARHASACASFALLHTGGAVAPSFDPFKPA